jgi:protease-4
MRVSKFILKTFAVIGFIATAIIALSMVVAWHQQENMLTEPENVILVLDFDEPIVEQNDPSPLSLAMHEDATPLFDILHAIDKAKDDPHVKGLIARFGTTQPSLAQSQEIRSAIARFRTSKKFTYAFASSYGSFGLGNRSYYLASAFENIWLQPVGSVSLTGIAVQSPFGKKALDKIGVKADFMQREEYKSFMEMAQRDDFSPPVRIMEQGMIDDLSSQISSGIAESRKWDEGRVKRLMERGPFTDKESEEAGLVTHIGYSDELAKEAEDKAGPDAKQVEIDDYMSYRSSGGTKAPKNKTTIALIYGSGLIVDKASGPGDLSGDHMMGADTIVDAFNDAADDKHVKAILFRIDSPGGSPEASESIRRALIHAQMRGKPVFVSMGDVAASGGYWVAMNADHIVAEPGTLTGSIGVLAGKFVVGGLMDKLGITFGTLKTTENAGMWSPQAEFTDAQRERVNALLDQTYHAFVKNVSDARKIPMEKMPDVAKGRVWTGAQGVKMGLIDELGGYDVTLGALRKKLNIGPDDLVSLEVFPPPETPVERVMKLLKGLGVESAMVRTALVQFQGLQTALGVSNLDVVSRGAVSARIPGAALNAVR